MVATFGPRSRVHQGAVEQAGIVEREADVQVAKSGCQRMLVVPPNYVVVVEAAVMGVASLSISQNIRCSGNSSTRGNYII